MGIFGNRKSSYERNNNLYSREVTKRLKELVRLFDQIKDLCDENDIVKIFKMANKYALVNGDVYEKAVLDILNRNGMHMRVLIESFCDCMLENIIYVSSIIEIDAKPLVSYYTNIKKFLKANEINKVANYLMGDIGFAIMTKVSEETYARGLLYGQG